MDRRDFLAISAFSGTSRMLAQTAGNGAPAALPPPPAAKITNSVMLWPLNGSFEERVIVAAKAGIQSVELRDEYLKWDDNAIAQARKFVNSFNMGMDAIVSMPDLDKTITAARKLNCRQIIVRDAMPNTSAALASVEKANMVLLLESPNAAADLKQVKEADTPHLRLAFQLTAQHTLDAVKGAINYTNIFHVNPTAAGMPYKEIYEALRKSGYSHYLAFEYAPPGDPMASLIHAADSFRAALVDHPGVTSN